MWVVLPKRQDEFGREFESFMTELYNDLNSFKYNLIWVVLNVHFHILLTSDIRNVFHNNQFVFQVHSSLLTIWLFVYFPPVPLLLLHLHHLLPGSIFSSCLHLIAIQVTFPVCKLMKLLTGYVVMCNLYIWISYMPTVRLNNKLLMLFQLQYINALGFNFPFSSNYFLTNFLHLLLNLFAVSLPAIPLDSNSNLFINFINLNVFNFNYSTLILPTLPSLFT